MFMLLDSEREEKEFLTELWWVFLEFNLHLILWCMQFWYAIFFFSYLTIPHLEMGYGLCYIWSGWSRLVIVKVWIQT
jgi:hypothetical protein